MSRPVSSPQLQFCFCSLQNINSLCLFCLEKWSIGFRFNPVQISKCRNSKTLGTPWHSSGNVHVRLDFRQKKNQAQSHLTAPHISIQLASLTANCLYMLLKKTISTIKYSSRKMLYNRKNPWTGPSWWNHSTENWMSGCSIATRLQYYLFIQYTH